MGILLELSINDIEADLICTICRLVLLDPVQDEDEHYFCRECINQWLKHKKQCPLDRSPLVVKMLKPPSRLLKNLLSRHKFRCENHVYGCEKLILYDNLKTHDKDCNFKPDKIIDCPNGCETRLKLNELKAHNCTKELKKSYNKTIKETNLMRTQIKRLERSKNEMEREYYWNQKNISHILTEQIEIKVKLKELEKMLKPVCRMLNITDSQKENCSNSNTSSENNSLLNDAGYFDTLCSGFSSSESQLDDLNTCLIYSNRSE